MMLLRQAAPSFKGIHSRTFAPDGATSSLSGDARTECGELL